MFKDSSDNPLTGFFNALQEKKGAKGIVKPGKVSANLTPEETARYKNIFKIMKDIVDPSPEAASVESTKQAKVAQTAQIKAAAGGGGSGGNMGAGALLALGAAAGLLANYLKDLKDRLAEVFGTGKVEGTEYIIRGLTSLRGIFGMLNVLGKIFQPLIKGFNLLKNSKAFKSLGGAASKVLKVGSKIGKAAGSLFKIVGKIGKTLGPKLKFIPFLGSIFNFVTAYEEFHRGNYVRAGLELLAGVLNLVPGIGNVAGSAINGVLLIYDIMSSSEQGKGLRDMLGNPGEKIKEFIKPIVDKIVGFFKGIGDWIAESAGKLVDMVKGALKVALPFLFEDDDKPSVAEQRAEQARRTAYRKKYIDRAKERLGDKWRQNMLEGESGLDYVNRQIRIEQEREYKGPYMSSREPGIDDGIVYQNGRATRINSKDSLIAAKAGGPIEKMLDQNSAIQSQQLNVLREIRDGIRALQSSGSSFADTSLTTQFYA